MHFRRAVPGDWPALWAIMEPVLRAGETYCWDPLLGEEAARREWFPAAGSPGTVSGADPTLIVFVAVEDDGSRVLGTAQLHANRGGPGAHVANASFLVAPAAAGRGVGRALAGFVLAEAASAGYAAMQFNAVVATNHRALALWTSLGFEVVGTVPAAFRHPSAGFVPLHIMHRSLEPAESPSLVTDGSTG